MSTITSDCGHSGDGLEPGGEVERYRRGMGKERVVAAMLSSPSLADAARKAGVSRTTLYRWLKQSAFRSTLKEARHSAVRQASAYIQGLAGEAGETLSKVMNNEKASAASQVSAARVVLEMTYQLLEADEVAERLERLERLKRGDEDGAEDQW